MAIVRRKAGRPLTEYEAKIIGPTGYRWVEASPGVFVTMTLHATEAEHAANLERYAQQIEAARREEASWGEASGS